RVAGADDRAHGEVWQGAATPELLAKIVSEAPPKNAKELSVRMSTIVAQTYALEAQRHALEAHRERTAKASQKLETLAAQLAGLETRLSGLRAITQNVSMSPPPVRGTSVAFGGLVSVGWSGRANVSANPGLMIESAKTSPTGRRTIQPYV